jgi:hypothetical protein
VQASVSHVSTSVVIEPCANSLNCWPSGVVEVDVVLRSPLCVLEDRRLKMRNSVLSRA